MKPQTKFKVPANSSLIKEIKLRVKNDTITIRDRETAFKKGWFTKDKP